jgi:hypothetical protein
MTVLEARRLANPAAEARKAYNFALFKATCHGEDTEREAFEWYAHLLEVVGPFADHPDVKAWFANEEARLLKLIG